MGMSEMKISMRIVQRGFATPRSLKELSRGAVTDKRQLTSSSSIRRSSYIFKATKFTNTGISSGPFLLSCGWT